MSQRMLIVADWYSGWWQYFTFESTLGSTHRNLHIIWVIVRRVATCLKLTHTGEIFCGSMPVVTQMKGALERMYVSCIIILFVCCMDFGESYWGIGGNEHHKASKTGGGEEKKRNGTSIPERTTAATSARKCSFGATMTTMLLRFLMAPFIWRSHLMHITCTH